MAIIWLHTALKKKQNENDTENKTWMNKDNQIPDVKQHQNKKVPFH